MSPSFHKAILPSLVLASALAGCGNGKVRGTLTATFDDGVETYDVKATTKESPNEGTEVRLEFREPGSSDPEQALVIEAVVNPEALELAEEGDEFQPWTPSENGLFSGLDIYGDPNPLQHPVGSWSIARATAVNAKKGTASIEIEAEFCEDGGACTAFDAELDLAGLNKARAKDGDGSGDFIMTCDDSGGQGFCIEYAFPDQTTLDDFAGQCGFGPRFDHSCPSGGLICRHSSGDGTTLPPGSTSWTYTYGSDAGSVESSCTGTKGTYQGTSKSR